MLRQSVIGLVTGFVTTLATTIAPAICLAQDAVKVAVGQRGAWDTSIIEIGQTKGIFAKHRIKPEVLWTQGSGETIQAVITGSVDMGVAIGTTGIMAAFAKGAPVRPISNSMTGADDLFWYVPADSPIKTMKDAAGKTVAYSTNGSSTHLAVLGFQRHFGVNLKITPTGGPPATLTQTMSGQIDVGWSLPPIGVDLVQQKKIRIIARESDVPEFRDQTVRMNIANLTFINGRADVLNRFRAAYQETIDWMYAGDEALEAYAAFAQVPKELGREIRDSFFPKDALRINRLSGIDNAMADALTLKFLNAPLSKEQNDELFKYYAK
jgi:NitT/TauT family transport system substrate-binding protein